MKVTNMSITNIKGQDMSVSHETVVNEFADVVQAMSEVPGTGILPGFLRGSNVGYATFVEKLLENKFGVKSDISLGFAGMGLVPNTYIDNESGKFLSHSEVIRRIRSATEASKK